MLIKWQFYREKEHWPYIELLAGTCRMKPHHFIPWPGRSQKRGAWKVCIKQEQGQYVTTLCKPRNHERSSHFAGWETERGRCLVPSAEQHHRTKQAQLHSQSQMPFHSDHPSALDSFSTSDISTKTGKSAEACKQFLGRGGFIGIKEMMTWCLV